MRASQGILRCKSLDPVIIAKQVLRMFEVARLYELACLIVGQVMTERVSVSVGQNSQVGRFKRHGDVPYWFNKRNIQYKLL